MATRKPSAEPKRGRGRPTKYTDDTARMAAEAVKLGATDADLARLFGVHVDTVAQWKTVHKEFSEALKRGKDELDAQVERRLFERAMGYSHPEDDIRAVNGQIVITPMVKHYPPDTVAAIFWLKNRRPDRWRAQPPDGEEGVIPQRVVIEVKDASVPDQG